MSNLIKKITLSAAFITGLATANLPPSDASAPLIWSRTYNCGEYTIGLKQYEDKSFSYNSHSSRGNLSLNKGTVNYTEGTRVIKFRNGDYEYWVWDGTLDSKKLGTLEVYRNNRIVMQRSCRRGVHSS